MVSISTEQLQQIVASVADWPARDRILLARKILETDVQRLRSVDSLWRSTRAILRAAIVTQHPDWDRERVNGEISRPISNGVVSHLLVDAER